jgi:hypothetical protein
MGKVASRITALGALVVSAAFAVPMSASADQADPALAGSCAATLQDGSGPALTLDAGASVNAPGVVTVGTGSNSATTGPAQHKPVLALPLADAVKALDLGNLPVAGDTATTIICPGAQNTVNAVSAATQSLLAGKQKEPAPPAGTPGPKPPAPQPPAQSVPASVAPNSTASDGGTAAQFASYPLGSISPSPASDLSALIGSAAVAPAAQGVVPPTGSIPVAQESGTAEAMPVASTTPAKLPLLLAAIALALVAAALAQIWLRRTPANS